MALNMLRWLSNTGPSPASLQWGRLALCPCQDVKSSLGNVIRLRGARDEGLDPDAGAAAVM